MVVKVTQEDRDEAKRLTDAELEEDRRQGARTVLCPPYDEFLVHRAYGIARRRERNEKLRFRRKRARDRRKAREAMATIVSGPKPKRVECKECEAVIEYLPEEVEVHHGRDYTGGADGYERVKCPRPGCPGHGYIRSW